MKQLQETMNSNKETLYTAIDWTCTLHAKRQREKAHCERWITTHGHYHQQRAIIQKHWIQ